MKGIDLDHLLYLVLPKPPTKDIIFIRIAASHLSSLTPSTEKTYTVDRAKIIDKYHVYSQPDLRPQALSSFEY